MLLHLAISNLTIIKHTSIDWMPGFCGITGETGAGKSIAMDALSLCLGRRADPSKIRRGEKEMTLSASFDVSKSRKAQTFLQELGSEAGDGECIIRRVICASGPSKAFVNGHPVTVKQLSQLGDALVSICSQHEQYALLKNDHQRELLDKYCSSDSSYAELLVDMSNTHKEYTKVKNNVAVLSAHLEEQKSHKQLLSYQVEELGDFSPIKGEFSDIERELSKLENAQELQTETEHCVFLLRDNEEATILGSLGEVNKKLESLSSFDSELTPIIEALNGAFIDIEEATKELRSYSESVVVDQAKLNESSERLSRYIELARKHGTQPENVYELYISLNQQLNGMQASDDELEQEKEKLTNLHKALVSKADKVSKVRKSGAKKLASFVKENMSELGMKDADVSFDISHNNIDSITDKGYDKVSLKFLGNIGEDFDDLSKVASGGELSRLNLILQLAIAGSSTTSTLVFDEVDTGISGPTAAKVGKILKKLGQKVQVISITHLPQVTAFADSHLYVSKKGGKERTETSLRLLTDDERIDEMARLLAGENIDEEAKKNAIALLDKGRAA